MPNRPPPRPSLRWAGTQSQPAPKKKKKKNRKRLTRRTRRTRGFGRHEASWTFSAPKPFFARARDARTRPGTPSRVAVALSLTHTPLRSDPLVRKDAPGTRRVGLIDYGGDARGRRLGVGAHSRRDDIRRGRAARPPRDGRLGGAPRSDFRHTFIHFCYHAIERSQTTRRAPATVREVADERGRTALSPEPNRASKTDPKDHTPKIQDSRACLGAGGCFLFLFFALPSLPSRSFARARTRRARAFPSSLAPRRGRRRLRRDVSGRQGRHRCVPQAGQGPRARRRSLRAVRSRRFAPSFPSRARDD